MIMGTRSPAMMFINPLRAFFLAFAASLGWALGELLPRLFVVALLVGLALLYFNGSGRFPF